MKKKLLTFDDLVKFCKKEKLMNFSAKESGYQLCVQVPTSFEIEEEENTSSTLYADLKMFHTNRNRNGSSVTEDAALKCLSTIPYKPLLGDIQEIEGTDGEYDFTSHSMEFNEDGSINYIERQIGCFTTENLYLDDKPDEKGRKYVHARAAIPREYTKAAEIIEKKDGTKVSVELAVNEFKYDSNEKLFLFTDIEVLGCTCLGRDPKSGKEIAEGMEGSRLDISDFSIDNNSVSSQDKIIEVIQELKDALDNYTASFADKNIERKEDKVELNTELFSQLLEKYNKTEADIEFEYSELDDDALSAAFEEAFGEHEDSSSEGDDHTEFEESEKNRIDVEAEAETEIEAEEEVKDSFDGDPDPADPDPADPDPSDPSNPNPSNPSDPAPGDPDPSNPSNPSDPSNPGGGSGTGSDPNSGTGSGTGSDPVPAETVNRDDGSDAEYLKKIQNEVQYSATFKGETKTFAKSLNETIYALSELINTTYGESDNDFYSVDVFDNKTVQFYGMFTGKNYRQSYKEKEGVYSLKGDRVELFARYLTQEECDALDNLQGKFEDISEKLGKYEAEPEKMAILESVDYSSIAESDEFIAFKAQDAHFDLSVDEVRAKADEMLLDAAKKGKVEFTKEETEKKTFNFKRIPTMKASNKAGRYGKLL